MRIVPANEVFQLTPKALFFLEFCRALKVYSLLCRLTVIVLAQLNTIESVGGNSIDGTNIKNNQIKW